MANLEILNPPQFSEEIKKVKEEDFITAAIENEIKRKLLNNDIFLKKMIEEIKPNFLRNPDFKIALRGDYFIKKGCTVYNEPTLVTDVSHLGLSEQCRKIYYKTDTYAAFLGENGYTYYVALSDIEKKYLGAAAPIVEGWHTGGYDTNVVTVQEDYLTIGSEQLSEWEDIFQTVAEVERLKGQTVTFTVKLRSHAEKVLLRLQDSEEEAYASAENTEDWEIVSLTRKISDTTKIVTVGVGIFQCDSGTVDIAWAKLEIGEEATPFVPPNPEVELLKCGGYAKASNPNLLDNADFRVNQRNGYITKLEAKAYYDADFVGVANESLQQQYRVTDIDDTYAMFLGGDGTTKYYIRLEDIEKGYVANDYMVDRWRGSLSSIVKILDHGIRTECYDDTHNQGVKQFKKYDMNLLVGKMFTLSLEIDTTGVSEECINNSNYCHWLNVNGVSTKIYLKEKRNSEILSLTGMIQYNTGSYRDYLLVQLNTITGTVIKWAKLELGEKATPFVPPDYASELLKCKYYYQEITEVGNPNVYTSDALHKNIRYSEMRIKPSAYFKNSIFNKVGYTRMGNTGGNLIDGFTFSLNCNEGNEVKHGLAIIATKAGHGLNSTNCNVVVAKGNPLCLNAEHYPQ